MLKTLFNLYLDGPSSTLGVASDDHAKLRAIASSAVKYSMRGAVQVIKHHIAQSKPLRPYLLATLFGWTEEAKTTAAGALGTDAAELQAFYDPALEEISSGPYFRLLQYHENCGKAAVAAVAAYVFPPASSSYCSSCGRYTSPIMVSAFQSYRSKMTAILRFRPHASVLSEAVLFSEILQMMSQAARRYCSRCRDIEATIDEGQVSAQLQAFKAAVERAISEVSLPGLK